MHEEALVHLRRAVALLREDGDRRAVGKNLNNMAVAYARLHRYAEAVDTFTEALRLHAEDGGECVEASSDSLLEEDEVHRSAAIAAMGRKMSRVEHR